MAYYKKFLKELETNGYNLNFKFNMKNKEKFEEEFKRLFPQKVINLIIYHDIKLAPILINSDSLLLSLSAKFCLSNPK